ncbi:hypothetical protein VNO77_30628 [Canavalia gladiata]|uniref:Uncharacterized protein n=1 Tax=Canavalia gladiata TaxID=3824 RepID=A0AAN9Q3M8_CANGL
MFPHLDQISAVPLGSRTSELLRTKKTHRTNTSSDAAACTVILPSHFNYAITDLEDPMREFNGSIANDIVTNARIYIDDVERKLDRMHVRVLLEAEETNLLEARYLYEA